MGDGKSRDFNSRARGLDVNSSKNYSNSSGDSIIRATVEPQETPITTGSPKPVEIPW
jgi:hypothetical protein